MGWPLILALLSTAANKESADQKAIADQEAASQQAKMEEEQRNRIARTQQEAERRAAMERVLKVDASPVLDTRVAEHTQSAIPGLNRLRAAQSLANLAQYGQQYGSYLTSGARTGVETLPDAYEGGAG